MKLIYGFGINDSKQPISKVEGKKPNQKIVWRCPFYVVWISMLQRCYDIRFAIRQPCYQGCTVCIDWKYFTNFKAWMETQDWEGKQLDKDLLVNGNKIYGPDTCVFINQAVNKFLTDSKGSRGVWPIGVYFHKGTGKFRAQCWSVDENKQKHLGLFVEAEAAHKAWLTFKLEQAKILASQQSDQRIANALIKRYENYV